MSHSVSQSAEGEATRTRLLNSAILEFAEKGFSTATVREICSRAEVNLNAVKYHFTDKQGLYVEAIREAHRRERVTRQLPTDEPTGTAEDRLAIFVSHMLSMVMEHDHQDSSCHLLMLREMAEPGEATRGIVREYVEPRFRILESILSEATDGQLPSFSLHLLAFSVVGQCLHYRLAWKIVPLLIPEEEVNRLSLSVLTEHICKVTMAAAREFAKS